MSPQPMPTMSDDELRAWERGVQLPYVVPEKAHGTWNGYSWWACRCTRCVDAMRDHDAERYARWRTRPEDKERQLRHFQATRLVQEYRQ